MATKEKIKKAYAEVNRVRSRERKLVVVVSQSGKYHQGLKLEEHVVERKRVVSP